MALTDPVPMTSAEIWSTLFGSVATGFGWNEIFVLFLAGAFTFLVFKGTGNIKMTFVAFLLSLIIFSPVGLPSWVSLSIFALLSWISIKTYKNMKGE